MEVWPFANLCSIWMRSHLFFEASGVLGQLCAMQPEVLKQSSFLWFVS